MRQRLGLGRSNIRLSIKKREEKRNQIMTFEIAIEQREMHKIDSGQLSGVD